MYSSGMVIKDEELATQLGVSKIPIRDALVQLAAEGWVDMPSNKVKQVAPLVRTSCSRSTSFTRCCENRHTERAFQVYPRFTSPK